MTILEFNCEKASIDIVNLKGIIGYFAVILLAADIFADKLHDHCRIQL
jgi:hypothetical protein